MRTGSGYIRGLRAMSIKWYVRVPAAVIVLQYAIVALVGSGVIAP